MCQRVLMGKLFMEARVVSVVVLPVDFRQRTPNRERKVMKYAPKTRNHRQPTQQANRRNR